ncbi:hypothetical protein [Corynebacterium phocae]|uniref:hypothetical protein n=1 Tax=Corynebacterium phocae TaxID=161895 RepID=UPI0012EEC273|nr:hypothetical protein [Corynebacterium phocae]
MPSRLIRYSVSGLQLKANEEINQARSDILYSCAVEFPYSLQAQFISVLGGHFLALL